MFKALKLFLDYKKFQSILKENVTMNKKITQIVALLVTIIGTFGLATYAQQWVDHNTIVYAVLVALAQLLHAFFPSIFDAPKAPTDPPQSNNVTKIGSVILLAMLLIPACRAQATVSTDAQNLYAGGVSYSINASPAIAGTALYGHDLNANGTYAFTIIDALPNTIRPFTVSTNVGAGIAQKVVTLDNIPIYVPTAAGISWSGSNTGWQWNGGVLAAIHVKGPYYVMPSVRFLKSSVSGGTGYQPLIGILFGWGK